MNVIIYHYVRRDRENYSQNQEAMHNLPHIFTRPLPQRRYAMMGSYNNIDMCNEITSSIIDEQTFLSVNFELLGQISKRRFRS